MARTIRRAILPALAAGALLAGCAGTPGTAAVIDGERLSESDAQALTEELNVLYGETLTTAEAIAIYAQSSVVRQVAAEADVSVARSQVVDELHARAEMVEYAPSGGEFLPETVDVSVAQALGPVVSGSVENQERALELLMEIDLELNPRYGTMTDLQLVPPTHPWLVEVTPAQG